MIRRGAFGIVAVVIAAVLFGVGSGDVPARAVGVGGSVPSSIVDRYLSVRPRLGPVTVVDVSSESADRRLLAAALQGVVNRSSARLYLVGARPATQDRHWLDDYVARGLVGVVANDSLDQALATFAHEASGYVVASRAEPWTINTATTVAAASHGLVVTPDLVPAMQALGLTQIDDEVGRWPDAITAYESIAAIYRDRLAYRGLAIVKPTDTAPRDFFVQQGIMTIAARPSDPDYDRLMALLAPYPTSHPVYGYVADTGTEEVQAIIRLSSSGRFLVPTDTTDNLSFHIAVGAQHARAVLSPDDRPVVPCTTNQVNVVITTSDGDNMVIPEAYLPAGDRWNSPRRGTLPVGWGISPATAVLMPSIWDSYVREATPDDEIVGIMGLGYGVPSLMSDPTGFLDDSNRLNAALGIESHWSLDLLLDDPRAAGWAAIDAANTAVGWRPKGYLLDYQNYGAPAGFTAAGLPVLTAQSTDYADGAPALAAHLDALLAMAPSERPLVNFLPVTVWNATLDAVVDAVGSYRDRGVRFLTPRQAFACLATPVVSTTIPPASTNPTTVVHPPVTGPVDTESPASVPSDTGQAAGSAVALPVNARPTYTG